MSLVYANRGPYPEPLKRQDKKVGAYMTAFRSMQRFNYMFVPSEISRIVNIGKEWITLANKKRYAVNTGQVHMEDQSWDYREFILPTKEGDRELAKFATQDFLDYLKYNTELYENLLLAIKRGYVPGDKFSALVGLLKSYTEGLVNHLKE